MTQFVSLHNSTTALHTSLKNCGLFHWKNAQHTQGVQSLPFKNIKMYLKVF